MDMAADRLAEEIDRLANQFTRQKGVIHATYQMAQKLSSRLQSERYLYHDRSNKREQYQLFRDSPTSEGRILVACGMYEGIDLPDDLGRWQVISKIPWMSLGNPAIRHLASLDPEWFNWETLKTLIQACGRICRTPTDYGITYILDGTVHRLFQEAGHMIPDWFRDAIVVNTEIQ